MNALKDLKEDLKNASNKEKAKNLARFFKTGKGEYAEGDIFLGLSVPQSRELVKKYFNLDFSILQFLLDSKIHEERLISLLILVKKYKNSDEEQKSKIVNFYLKNTKSINNWDLVDLSAPNILGDYLSEKPKYFLYSLANSKNLWEKRIAIISTLTFIRKNQFADSLKIAEILLNDSHDLIHKAVGWMLREIGKRNKDAEKSFLKKHYKSMPRTMLRYAIEKFPENERQAYLNGII